MASFCGHTEIVKMLLGHPGIDVNLQDKVKLHIIEVICISTHISILPNDEHTMAPFLTGWINGPFKGSEHGSHCNSGDAVVQSQHKCKYTE